MELRLDLNLGALAFELHRDKVLCAVQCIPSRALRFQTHKVRLDVAAGAVQNLEVCFVDCYENRVARVVVEQLNEHFLGQPPVFVRPLYDGTRVQIPDGWTMIKHELAQRLRLEVIGVTFCKAE